MTKLEATLSHLAKLPDAEREELVAWIDEMLDDLEAGGAGLSPAQLADLKQRAAEPEDLASDEEAAAFFARHDA